jgi:hypothetical protein
MRIRVFALALAFAAPFALATEDVREAQAPLRHAENDLQPDAHGGVGIRSGPDFERFSVGVEGVGEDVSLRVLLGNGDEDFVEIGTLPPGSSNRQLVRTTLEGGELPLGVEHVDSLSGHGVRVEDGEHHLILVGEVPHFQDAPDEPPPPSEPVVTHADLQRPEDGVDADARGVVVSRHGDDGDALIVEVGHLDSEHGYLFYVGSGEGDGMVLVDDFSTNGDGAARIAREAAAGQPLGDNLPSLADLAGRRVEIRDLDGHVILFGHVPDAATEHDDDPVHEEGDVHDEASGADVHIVLDIHPDSGHERLNFDMHDLPHEGDAAPDGGAAKRRRIRPVVEVWLDDGTGTPALAGSTRMNRRGNARLRWTTRRGGSLPLAAATLRELAGRGFEVRVGGDVVLGGNLPSF